jgi:hypothetical protein
MLPDCPRVRKVRTDSVHCDCAAITRLPPLRPNRRYHAETSSGSPDDEVTNPVNRYASDVANSAAGLPRTNEFYYVSENLQRTSP